MPDEQLLERATELSRILVTRDDDFLVLAGNWNKAARHFSGIVHLVHLVIGRLINDLHLVVEVLPPEEMRDRVIHLPL